MSESGRDSLVYAEQITVADIEAINSFLVEQTSRLASSERGSDERHVSRSVRAALLYLVGTMVHAVPHCVGEGVDVDVQRALRLQVETGWNTLWALVSPWKWHNEFDGERWRHVKYWNAAQEAEMESRLGRDRE
ncbi:hypothetical protein GCM10010442_16250 [Kitasatospora kifunensis]